METRPPLPPRPALPAPASAPAEPSLNVRDVYYIVFRHKWKILFCSLAGIGIGLGFFKMSKPPFQSEMRLLVRYVDSSPQLPAGGDDGRISPDKQGETIMATEMEILTSADTSKKVAEAVGAEKVLAKAGGGKDLNAAAALIHQNLTVTVPQRSATISVLFKHPDPEIVQPVLRELFTIYMKTHQDIHKTAGMMNDFMGEETDKLKAQLQRADEELVRFRTKTGFISIEDAKTSIGGRMNHLRQQIGDAQAILAEKKAAFDVLSKRAAALTAPQEEATTTATSTEKEAPANVATLGADTLEVYQDIKNRLGNLQAREQGLLSTFRGENTNVQNIRTQIEDAKKEKRDLEAKYPQLIALAPATAGGAAGGPMVDLVAADAEITALNTRIAYYLQQVEAEKKNMAMVDETELGVLDAMRNKQVFEENYFMYRKGLVQNRIREALSTGKVDSIMVIQEPTSPFVDRQKVTRTAAMMILGGIALGFGWAFLIEMLLDRSVRRPVEFERFGLPLFLSVPDDKKLRGGKKRLSLGFGKKKTSTELGTEVMGTFDPKESLRPFHETLRDRLIGYFERRNLTHKPKLIAVTGIGSGGGVTTTAAGLARALSETGDGNVLVVDMTAGQGSAQQFSHGLPVAGLESMLATRETSEPVEDNLYIVTENSNGDKLSRIMPQRFSKLLPKLKSSDFDYIIFDMPPVSQISITPRLAEFMDMVLLVVESEKTDRETVQKAAALLAETKAHVGALLNKTRDYVPSWLHKEHMGSI